MKIFVTGGKGFIGKRLVERLRQRGHYVLVYSGRVNLGGLLVKEIDSADIVFHLAAEIDEAVPKDEMFDTNVNGTRNVLEVAAKAKVKHFIHLSTVGVYGSYDKKADENTPVAPYTNYEQSKAEAEKLVLGYQEVFPVTIVRSALVYGANENWRKIIKMVKGGFPIIGHGNYLWQMVYVDDLVEALALMPNNAETFGETYIVAEEKAYSFKEIYAIIQKFLGIEKKPFYIPVWLGKIVAYAMTFVANVQGRRTILLPQHVERLTRNRIYDVSKIKKLGWLAKTSLEEGLRKTVGELKL